MTETLVTYSCGHSGYLSLFSGNDKKRAKDAAYYGARNICPACKAAADAAKSAQAAEMAKLAGLPTLTGTPKQIAWAETIRAQVLPRLSEIQHVALQAIDQSFAESADADGSICGTRHAAARDALIALILDVRDQPKADWWIDHRGGNGARVAIWIADKFYARTKIHGLTVFLQDDIDWSGVKHGH